MSTLKETSNYMSQWRLQLNKQPGKLEKVVMEEIMSDEKCDAQPFTHVLHEASIYKGNNDGM